MCRFSFKAVSLTAKIGGLMKKHLVSLSYQGVFLSGVSCISGGFSVNIWVFCHYLGFSIIFQGFPVIINFRVSLSHISGVSLVDQGVSLVYQGFFL